MSYVFVLLFFVSLLGLIIGLIKPDVISKLARVSFSRKKVGLVFGILALLFFILTGVSGNQSSNQPVNQDSAKQTQVTPSNTQPKVDYEIVSKEELKLVDNYWLLIKSQDKSTATLEPFTKEFKKQNCKKDCNISLYDDKKAVDLDLAYSKIRDMAEANTWKEKNYIYVADHLVGYMAFGGDFYNDYPYKDSYYKELKGE